MAQSRQARRATERWLAWQAVNVGFAGEPRAIRRDEARRVMWEARHKKTSSP